MQLNVKAFTLTFGVLWGGGSILPDMVDYFT